MYSEKSNNLFNKLKESGIVGAVGSVHFKLLNIDVNISDKSATGNLIQEWLGSWMSENNIYFRIEENTQLFPDFYLGEDDKTNLLEVKSFDYTKSPNFDIANFDTYTRSIRDNAFRLDADYLIFGYDLSEGILTIKDIWLKKVWEITCGSEKYPIRTQVKQNIIHNIRPYNFKNNSNGYQPFRDRKSFVVALRDTIESYDPSRDSKNWYEDVKKSYKEFSSSGL